MLDYEAMAEDIISRLESMSKEEYIAFMKKCGIELVDVEKADSNADDHPGPFMQMYYDFYGLNPEDEPPLDSF